MANEAHYKAFTAKPFFHCQSFANSAN